MQRQLYRPTVATAPPTQRRGSRSAQVSAPPCPRGQQAAAPRRQLAVAAAPPGNEPPRDVLQQDSQPFATSAEGADAVGQSKPAAPAPPASPDVGAQASPAVQAAHGGRQRWRALLLSCWQLLQRNLWPLVVAHGVTDALVFLLHRLSHRATNEVAVRLLGGGALTPAAIGNMWWLNTDPNIANFTTGYQVLTFAFFLVAFPLNVAIKTWASCATILLCRRAAQPGGEHHHDQPPQPQQQPEQQPEQPVVGPAEAGAAATAPQHDVVRWWHVRRGLRQAFATLKSISGQVSALWRPVFVVELLVAAVVVPAQFASLAVVTLPLTLPLIVELQAGGPVAALDGLRGMAAVKRSRALLRRLRWQLAVPFVGLVVAGRLLEGAKATLLSSMPPRFYQELVELPLLVLLGGTVMSVLIARMQDVLPMAAYAEARAAEEAPPAAQPGAALQAVDGSSGA